jgi:hypothetical protein
MDIETIQVNLNSKFASKYINDSHSDCLFDLPNIEIPSQHHIHISVRNAIIPYSFYNINSTNNFLIYIANNVTYTYILDIGNYNALQLVKYLNTLIVSSGLSCNYNIITNKLTFTHSTYNFIFSSNSTCLSFMGFIYTSLSLSTNKVLISNNCLNLQNVQSIHIQTNFITGNINSSELYKQNTLCTIPINTSPYSNITYDNSSNFSTNLYSNLLNEIYIKLVDQDNNLINLNGLDWSITLQVEILDFVN